MAKFWSHGANFSFGGTDIGGIVNLELPSRSRGEVDLSDGDSGGNAEFVAGLRDNGEVTLNMRLNFGDSGQQALVANFDAASGTNEECIITAPATAEATAVTVTFDGYVSNLGGELPQTGNEAASRTATIRVSGDVTEEIAS